MGSGNNFPGIAVCSPVEVELLRSGDRGVGTWNEKGLMTSLFPRKGEHCFRLKQVRTSEHFCFEMDRTAAQTADRRSGDFLV